MGVLLIRDNEIESEKLSRSRRVASLTAEQSSLRMKEGRPKSDSATTNKRNLYKAYALKSTKVSILFKDIGADLILLG